MAEYKPRIDLKDRTRLETVIPLDTPYLIFLDPSNVCNAACGWCPTGSKQALKFSQPRIMEFSLYKRIIDSITKMPSKVKTLRLYSDGEPLLNTRFPDMVRYAKATGFFNSVDTTTNGLLLNEGLSPKILDSGLDRITISVPFDYTPAYLHNIKVFTSLAEDRFAKYRCVVYVKAIRDLMSLERQNQFLEDFTPYSDYIFLENLAPCWPTFQVKGVSVDKGIYDQELSHVDVCPYVFYSTKINSDGTVSLCFLDWRHYLIMGDLKFQSFAEIWNGKMYRFFRSIMLQKRRSDLIFCSKCKQLEYGMPDDIDAYAQELLEKI